MRKNLVLGAVVSLTCLPLASWAAPRTFVKSTGSDGNPCSLTAPCRNFQPAVNAVDAGGEVVVLDSGGFGMVSINKAVTISAPLGVFAGITGTTGNAVTIFAGINDVVTLRGLTIKGAGGSTAVAFNTGAALHIESCVISGFSGVSVSSGGTALFVKDTVMRDGGASGLYTISNTSIADTRFDNFPAGCGIEASTGSVVTAVDSDISRTSTAWCSDGDPSVLSIRRGSATDSIVGVLSFGANAVIRAADMIVTGNNTGFRHDSGTFESLGNNFVRGNTSNLSGTITIVGGK